MATKTRSAASCSDNETGLSGLSKESKNIVALIRKDLNALKCELLQQMEEKYREVDVLKCEVKLLRNKVAKLEERLDDSDSYERRDTLISLFSPAKASL
jgi:peptidoglycan hydrolase CwlO-like protein